MSRLTDRAKKAMLNKEIILTYDGEYWIAYANNGKDTVIARHSVLDVLFDAVFDYFKGPTKDGN